jgi:hypothetical protein
MAIALPKPHSVACDDMDASRRLRISSVVAHIRSTQPCNTEVPPTEPAIGLRSLVGVSVSNREGSLK